MCPLPLFFYQGPHAFCCSPPSFLLCVRPAMGGCSSKANQTGGAPSSPLQLGPKQAPPTLTVNPPGSWDVNSMRQWFLQARSCDIVPTTQLGVVDSHTMGEPTRCVVSGLPTPGSTKINLKVIAENQRSIALYLGKIYKKIKVHSMNGLNSQSCIDDRVYLYSIRW